MRAWNPWRAEWSTRVKTELKWMRQLVKMHKKLYSRYRPFKGYQRKYRHRNARERMSKKARELIRQRNGVW